MKAAILALVATGALLISSATADARPPHSRGGGYHGYHGGYNHGYYGYRGYNGVRSYPSYGGYYGGYYPRYYNSGGFFLNLGRFSLGIGNGYSYPYSGGYYSYPYYRGW